MKKTFHDKKLLKEQLTEKWIVVIHLYNMAKDSPKLKLWWKIFREIVKIIIRIIIGKLIDNLFDLS